MSGESACSRLVPQGVDVWIIDLDTLPDRVAMLSADERARAASILSPLRSQRWARSRAGLREILGRYRPRGEPLPAFDRLMNGKPYLPGGPYFNLSHCGPQALLAVALEGPVGVDIELERPGREIDLSAWVRREAAAKCLGTGIWGTSLAGVTPWLTELTLAGGAHAALACARAPQRISCLRYEPEPQQVPGSISVCA